MASVEEISVKLGINVADFKVALKEAGTSVKAFEKLGAESNKGFVGGIKDSVRGLNDFKQLIAGGAIAGAVTGFFNLAIEGAKASTDATDKNAAAVREFARGLDEVKGTASKVAVATVGFFNRIGSAIGDLINFNLAFAKGGQEGAKIWNDSRKLAEETGKAAEAVEARLAAVRKKDGAELIAITKEIADIQKKQADQQLKGLTVYDTEANLAAKLAELRAKALKGEGEAIDKRRIALEIAKTGLALEEANLAVRKARADAEEKAAEEERKSIAEFTKFSQERRKEQSLSADKEAELFALRKKNTDAAVAQGKADLNIVTLQNQQYLAQMEIVKLRAKLTASLSESEKAQLDQLGKESLELQKQIGQKQTLIDSSNKRDPVEAKLLDQLNAQALAIELQIKGLTARAGVTSNFTDAEAKFLAQLQQQKVAIFEQIDLLEKRALVPNSLTKEEEALLVPLKEQGRVYTLLIAQLKERASTGNAQTAEEVQYLDALKASSATLATQIGQLRDRNTAGIGLSDAERKTLEEYKAQAVALADVIANLNQRQNSSVGLTDDEAKLLPLYLSETAELEKQIAAMARREGSTGNLAAIEAGVLDQWEAQQKALLEQIETMKARKNVTTEQASADAARLSSLLQARDATAAQIEAQVKGSVAIKESLAVTVKMSAAEKERMVLLDFQKKLQEQLIDLKRIDEKIQREGINEDLRDARKIATENIAETEKQIAQRVKISLGIKEDLELFQLQSKNVASLTSSEKLRLDTLLLQTKEKRLQIEIETLHGKLMDGTITPAEDKRLKLLIKQKEEIGKQIEAKTELVGKINQAETAQIQLSAAIQAGAQMMDEEARRASILADELQRAAAAQASLRGTITNTGDIGTLDTAALKALNATIEKQLSFEQSQTLNQRQDTIIEASLRAQLLAIENELKLRQNVVRIQDVLGSAQATVKFGQDVLTRINGLAGNLDVQKQTATGVTALVNAFGKVFPEAFKNIR